MAAKQGENKNTKCAFSIQIYAGKSREDAMTFQKTQNVKNTKLNEGEIKGAKWYRIRSGCYASREDAKSEIEQVKKKFKNAIIVAE